MVGQRVVSAHHPRGTRRFDSDGKVESRCRLTSYLKLVPLQFFTNDFGIKRDQNSREDEDVPTTQNSEQGFLGFSPGGRSR